MNNITQTTMTVNKNRFNAYQLAVIALVLLSVILSAHFSRQVFERLPHLEDEVAYLFQAKVFARGQVMAEPVDPINAYWQPFVVDYPEHDTRFSKYPPGWSALLSIGLSLGAGWIINAFIAGLTVALTYRLASDIYNRDVGLFAAMLVTFSPMALLLNGTLMAHTSALFWATLFMWAYWRMMHSGWRWGAVAGVALGMLIIHRPLTAVGIALPFIMFSGVRLLWDVIHQREQLLQTLKPLLAVSVLTLVVGSALAFYNVSAVDDPFVNLYTYVPGWEYDRIGFGEEIGRNGHTLIKGIQHLRYDLSLTAADLFGWQLEGFTPEPQSALNSRISAEQCGDMSDASVTLQEHLRSCSGYWRGTGLSWLLLAPGLIAGLRRNWAWVWVVLLFGWVLILPDIFFTYLELWALAGVILALVPLLFLFPRLNNDHHANWTWLFFAVIFSLLAVHSAYWVGSQRYSTRYYFEALSAAALLSALPLAWLVREARQPALKGMIYGGFVAVCLWSFFSYSQPRIEALTGFNRVTQNYVDAINSKRTTDQPVLVIASTDTARRWRSVGSLMAVSSPFLDSDIEFAWNEVTITGRYDTIVEQFPGYEILDVWVDGEDAYLLDECTDAGCIIINDPAQPYPVK